MNLTLFSSAKDGNEHLVKRVLWLVAILSVIMAVCGGLTKGKNFALSVVYGSVLATTSFWLLQRDIRRLLDRVASHGESEASFSGMEKLGFLVKMYGRIIVLGLILFTLATKVTIHPAGLILGLSTVMVSVIIVGVGRRKKKLSGIS